MPDVERGFILAATGKPEYVRLALRAAEDIKRFNPGIEVDLFTDKSVTSPSIDMVHIIEEPWARTKIDAMLASRFQKTIYLDADIIPVAPILDVFLLLDRFDLVAAHDQYRNRSFSRILYKEKLPAAFPQVNSGVLGFRYNDEVISFFRDWHSAVLDHNIGRDQPSLRELIWQSELDIYVLPPEFNVMNLDSVKDWRNFQPAPRIIHSPNLHHDFDRFNSAPNRLVELLGLRASCRLHHLLEMDREILEMNGESPPELQISDLSRESYLELIFWCLRYAPQRIRSILVRKLLYRATKMFRK